MAAPSISIYLLSRVLFSDTSQAHHRFRMLDQESGRSISNAVEVHTVELTKYKLDERTISRASKLQQWAFLLLYAQDYDAKTLRRLLPGIEFETAISTIETISAKSEDKQMYDQRGKAQRDYEWAISGAREEGLERGLLAGRIQTLQELLGDAPTPASDLADRSLASLTNQHTALRQRLRDRQA